MSSVLKKKLRQVSVPASSFIQQQTPGLIAQGSESSEPSAPHGAGENLQDSVSGQQQVIVPGIVQQQVPSTAQGSSNLEEHGPPPPVDGHIDLEARCSPEVDNNSQQNKSSANNALSEESLLGQPKKESGSEGISSSRQPMVTRSGVIQSSKIACPVDVWISDLVEFEETRLSSAVHEMSITDALYKLEASKDIPIIKLVPFNGSPLRYVEFIEQFRIHIHDKPHLKDDTRMVQLRMHVTGEAERTISGLGSQGIMCTTTMKMLKENFGQPSVIARAFIRKITERRKIQLDDRQALRESSFDMINCLATLRQINYFANDNLQKIVRCLPDHLIEKWKNVATDIREKSEIPQLEHISNFVRKRAKAKFDPDFGDVLKMDTSRNVGFRREDRRGIHSNTKASRKAPKCYICQAEHRVHDCPTMADSSPEERIQHTKNRRLSFSYLVRGHPTRQCRSRNKYGKNGCTRIHHPLLHIDPPTNSGVASILDKGSIMPVVRVQFKAANGKVQEGNVPVDSGAGKTVI